MNAITPMIIPRRVRKERSLCAHIADKASFKVSVKFIVRQICIYTIHITLIGEKGLIGRKVASFEKYPERGKMREQNDRHDH
jgi:hypothetical protein